MKNALKKMPNFLKIVPFFQSLYWKTENDHKAATTKETKTVTSGGGTAGWDIIYTDVCWCCQFKSYENIWFI